MPAGEDFRLHQVRHFLHDLPDIDPGLLEHHSSALDAAHIEDIVDQLQEVVAGSDDLIQAVFDPDRIIQVRGSDVGKAYDRVHRRPDVMGHIGQERVLGVSSVSGLFERVL